jgi:hypothetical protein
VDWCHSAKTGRGSPPGNRQGTSNRAGQIWWPPLGSFHGRQRAAIWPSLGSFSWPSSDQRSIAATDGDRSCQLSGVDDCAPYTFQAGHAGSISVARATVPARSAAMSARPLIVITAALQAWAALPVIFRGGRGRLRCHQGRSTLAGRRTCPPPSSGPGKDPASSRPREAGDISGTCPGAAHGDRGAARTDRRD